MSEMPFNADDAQLRRLARVKQPVVEPWPTLGPELISFFKQDIERRQKKFGAIAQCWSQLIPQTLIDHTALQSFSRGQLVVVVDSSPHLFELKQLLLAGLQKQILLACRSSGLRKITLKPGTWYDEADASNRKLRF